MSPRRRPLVFYLGAHRIDWLSRLRVPLFVSHRRLRKWQATPKRRPLKAATRWVGALEQASEPKRRAGLTCPRPAKRPVATV